MAAFRVLSKVVGVEFYLGCRVAAMFVLKKGSLHNSFNKGSEKGLRLKLVGFTVLLRVSIKYKMSWGPVLSRLFAGWQVVL